MGTAIEEYLASSKEVDSGMLAYVASLQEVAKVSPETAAAIVQELADQRSFLKLIASENYCSLSTQLAMGNLLTDKYAEGFPGHRFYAGCGNVDAIESLACEQAMKVFDAEHAYIQPHSGADANLIAFWAILNTRIEVPSLEELGQTNVSKLCSKDWDSLRAKMGNQRLMGMDYYCGGHLTHGYRHNVSARMFDAYSYGVNAGSGLLDYEAIAAQAREVKPFILLAGYSAYPREINFRKMREIADEVGAVLMVDMAHFAGLVAGGVFSGDFNPVPFAHVVTTTTHKTLRGPRGGMVLCKKEFADAVDKGCPLVIGGPLPHVMAAKAVTFTEALKPEFKTYAAKVVENASALAGFCSDLGMTLATGGTDNHLFLIDVRSYDLTGRQAESVMRDCGITLNRNSLPDDPNGPWYTSGLRLGTPAITTLGMGVDELKEIAEVIHMSLDAAKPATVEKGANAGKPSKAKYDIDNGVVEEAKARIRAILDRFPLYPQLDLEFLQQQFCK